MAVHVLAFSMSNPTVSAISPKPTQKYYGTISISPYFISHIT
jgi:hypothetical protein